MTQRVIEVLTADGVGATYVPINRYATGITVQAEVVGGPPTFTVDYTLADIVRGLVNPYDIAENVVAPAAAQWTNLIASGAANAAFNGTLSAVALRVNITAGTGRVRLRVSQTAEIQ